MTDKIEIIYGDIPKRFKDMGDGTFAEVVSVSGSLGSGSSSSAPQTVTYSNVAGSPFTLVAGTWTKVATTTSATKALRIAPTADATSYDLEWVAVAAGAAAPTDTYGEPILGGEDFASGIPIGDVYVRSAAGNKVVVRTGA